MLQIGSAKVLREFTQKLLFGEQTGSFSVKHVNNQKAVQSGGQVNLGGAPEEPHLNKISFDCLQFVSCGGALTLAALQLGDG